jgi:NADH:ubiquinone oxidoreductase subunit 6 (subunit J)
VGAVRAVFMALLVLGAVGLLLGVLAKRRTLAAAGGTLGVLAALVLFIAALQAGSINSHTLFFLLFAGVTCVFAVAVVVSSNIVRMAFYLIVSLGATAGLFFLAGAPLVGAMQLMIYVGGTLVLLVFGVMLTAQGPFMSMKTHGGEWVLAAIVGGSLLVVLLQAAFSVGDWRQPLYHQVRVEFAAAPPGTREASAEFDRESRRLTVYIVPGSTTAAEAMAAVEALRQPFALSLPRRGSQTVGLAASPAGSAQQPTAAAQRSVDPDAPSDAAPPQAGLPGAVQVTPAADDAGGASAASRRPQRAGGLVLEDAAQARVVPPKTTDSAAPIGLELIGRYLLPFEIISVHLLVVLIGAAYLARTKKRASETT